MFWRVCLTSEQQLEDRLRRVPMQAHYHHWQPKRLLASDQLLLHTRSEQKVRRHGALGGSLRDPASNPAALCGCNAGANLGTTKNPAMAERAGRQAAVSAQAARPSALPPFSPLRPMLHHQPVMCLPACPSPPSGGVRQQGGTVQSCLDPSAVQLRRLRQQRQQRERQRRQQRQQQARPPSAGLGRRRRRHLAQAV